MINAAPTAKIAIVAVLKSTAVVNELKSGGTACAAVTPNVATAAATAETNAGTTFLNLNIFCPFKTVIWKNSSGYWRYANS